MLLPRAAWLVALLVIVAGLFVGCGDDDSAGPSALTASPATSSATTATIAPASSPTAVTSGQPLALTSDAFANNANIPVDYSCDGKSLSPALAWTGEPAGTKAFALILHDPDAGAAGGAGFTHWVLYDIPADAHGLSAGASPGGPLPEGTVKGANSAGANQYTGMCPPRGGPAHHYQFTLYALDTTLGLPAGAKKADVEKAMQGHMLAQTLLVGLFAR